MSQNPVRLGCAAFKELKLSHRDPETILTFSPYLYTYIYISVYTYTFICIYRYIHTYSGNLDKLPCQQPSRCHVVLGGAGGLEWSSGDASYCAIRCSPLRTK